jgi:putative membrane protein
MRHFLATASAIALLAAAPLVASGSALAQTSTGPTGGTYSTNPANIPGHRGNADSSAGTATTSPRSAAAKTLGREDLAFARKAAQGGLGEVELGQLAQQRASSPDVKQFAQRMVTDHQQANAQLEAIATGKGVTMPKTIDPDQRKLRVRLEKENGTAFDRAYIRGMVQDHRKDVKLFQREAQSGKDPELRSFAQQTLPILQEHLQMVQQIQSQLSPAMTSSRSGSVSHSGSSTPSSHTAQPGTTIR